MNTQSLLVLIAMLSLLPGISQAKSPWDKAATEAETAPAETTADPQMVEPLEPQAIAAEPEMVEPAPPEPVEPVAESPAPPMADSEPAAPETIEVIETTGDVLAMPQPTQREIDASPMLLLDFPRRGMDQDKVQSELGTPVEIKDPVGQPPITRWIYSDRVVYFEYSTVLHVVAR
jgi:hypothetical protein